MELTLEPTVSGAALAALAVAGGAPWFSDGLRALRLRRHLKRLNESRLEDSPTGFIHTRGSVVLDGPLFSPLSSRPCAGFRLEVHGPGARTAAVIERRRSFRIVAGAISARVMAPQASWRLTETARREMASGEGLTENMAALLEDCPEAVWLRRQDRPLVLVEHALFAGSECHVVGQARVARPHEMAVEIEAVRTGTDDAEVRAAGGSAAKPNAAAGATVRGAGANAEPPRTRGPFGVERRSPGRQFPGEADLWIDGGGHIDFVLVSDRPPIPAAIALPAWRTIGVLLGPALSLAALLYLAHAADQLRSRGRL